VTPREEKLALTNRSRPVPGATLANSTMNSDFLAAVAPASTPERVITNWRRFSSGLWRVPEGDISAAYCAESFPKVKVFTHEGRLFANCGGHFSGPIHAEKDCYQLLPADEYRGPEPRRYTYEGREAAYKGRVFRLGPKVQFIASDPTVEEWRHLIQVLYADGGMFASRCTYTEFLANRLDPGSENGRAARFKELAECGARRMPRTQEEMCHLLDREGGFPVAQSQQIDLGL